MEGASEAQNMSAASGEGPRGAWCVSVDSTGLWDGSTYGSGNVTSIDARPPTMPGTMTRANIHCPCNAIIASIMICATIGAAATSTITRERAPRGAVVAPFLAGAGNER